MIDRRLSRGRGCIGHRGGRHHFVVVADVSSTGNDRCIEVCLNCREVVVNGVLQDHTTEVENFSGRCLSDSDGAHQVAFAAGCTPSPLAAWRGEGLDSPLNPPCSKSGTKDRFPPSC